MENVFASLSFVLISSVDQFFILAGLWYNKMSFGAIHKRNRKVEVGFPFRHDVFLRNDPNDVNLETDSTENKPKYEDLEAGRSRLHKFPNLLQLGCLRGKATSFQLCPP